MTDIPAQYARETPDDNGFRGIFLHLFLNLTKDYLGTNIFSYYVKLAKKNVRCMYTNNLIYLRKKNVLACCVPYNGRKQNTACLIRPPVGLDLSGRRQVIAIDS